MSLENICNARQAPVSLGEGSERAAQCAYAEQILNIPQILKNASVRPSCFNLM